MKKTLSLLCAVVAMECFAQSLPHHWTVDDATHQIRIGDNVENGIFNVNQIDTIYLEFSSSNWFNTLTNNYAAGTELLGTLTYQGTVYNEVGVSFKGATSYNQTNGEEKKSFNIRMDSSIPGQDLDGYDVLNLNNCFEDASFLREFIYLYLIRHEIPAANAAFVILMVNGESWGIYPMVQQLDGGYAGEWFLSNDGTRWRADKPAGQSGGQGGGPGWGDGTAALNYLGTDATEYQQYYTLKGSTVADPWSNLIETCDVLNNTSSSNLTTELPNVLDVDRTLWFLACENIFGDDDSYVFKGKMDYYLYWEPETGRMTPLEYDGNSVLVNESANWGVFYHADNANYPLLNKMLAVPEYRQRYLAHYRTIINELVDPALADGLIAQFGDFIDPHVQADTKKLYTYSQFTTDVTALHNKLQTRRNLVMTNSELNTLGAEIMDVTLHTSAGSWQSPVADETVTITAHVISPDGIDHVTLYYSSELVGNFMKVNMLDDGSSNDGAPNDGVYGALIPGMSSGTVVRFYVEAVEANTAKTSSYDPIGAEHDVYYYNVLSAWATSTDVVINEAMAKNTNTSMDELSEYEDWIELYNRGISAIDLTNYFITDNSWNVTKWQIPDGTIMQPDSYLILWADEDSTDGSFHTNFKLSSIGETITLINSNGEIADQVVFGLQQADLGYARNPNGTGDFVIQQATFSSNNNNIGVNELDNLNTIQVFPNPTRDIVYFKSKEKILWANVYDSQGILVMQNLNQNAMDLSAVSSGIYLLQIMDSKAVLSNFRVVKN
jgi:hypothetical protein